MDRKRKVPSIRYNFLMNGILRMSSFLFPLITFPYISRTLGAEGNGQIAFAGSFVGYFSLFASLGIPTYGVRVCSQCRDDKEKLSRTVQELLIIHTVTMIVSYIAMFIAVSAVPALAERKEMIWISSVSLFLSLIGLEWFYQAIEDYRYITYRSLAFRILFIMLMFLCVHGKEDLMLYAWISVLGSAGSNLFNLLRIRKHICCRPLGHYRLGKHIKPAVMLFLLTAASTVYNNLDAVMLGFLSGDEQVGYYTAATKMKNILVSFVTALGAVLLPRISYYLKNGLEEEFVGLIRNSVRFVMASALPLMLFFMIEAKDVILILAGEGYRESAPAMIAIMPTVLFIGLSNIIGIQIFIPMGLERYTVFSTIVGAAVDLVINMALIPRYGALGAAIGTVTAEAIVLAVQVYLIFYGRKGNYLRTDRKDMGKVLAAATAAAVCLFLWRRGTDLPGYLFSFIAGGSIFWGVYGAGCLLEKESVAVDLWDSLAGFIKSVKGRK